LSALLEQTLTSPDRKLAMRCLSVLTALALLVGPATFAPSAAAAPPSGAELPAGAAARIEEHRKADVVVTVTDAAGRPVPSARVEIEQTRHAFLFGCNAFLFGRAGNGRDEAAYREQFAGLFNFASLPFYWPSYEPRRGQTDHARIERVARWCRANGITPKGHPLAWNHSDPRWLPDGAAEVRALQMARIDECVRRFAGLIGVWDVVNEATHFERDEFKKRAPRMTAMWQETGRVEFVRECFRHARAAGPKATLLINDYRTDDAYAALLRELSEAPGGRPFDVIGIQSHMHGGTWSNAKVWEVCERFARIGVPLHFTEATILSGEARPQRARGGRAWPSTADGEKRQAEDVERFYTMLFSHPAVAGITWWDFSDRAAWQGAPAGLLRRDMSPKPAYERLRELIRKRWWTHATIRTGATGQAECRVFLGEHRVKVTTAAGARVVTTLSVTRGGDNRLTLQLP
jgi:GH35 family endo-1,4-beta-xylanase